MGLALQTKSSPPKKQPKHKLDLSEIRELLATFGPIGDAVWEVGRTLPDKEQRPYMEDSLRTLAASVEVAFIKEGEYSIYKDNIPPVSFTEFIVGKEFLDRGHEVWPEVLKYGEELNSGKYIEAVLTGGIGSAKTSLANYTIAYQIYVLSRYKNPHAEFGLASSDEIVFAIQSFSSVGPTKNAYDRLYNLITASPYFINDFPYNKEYTTELIFPNRICCRYYSGSSQAAIGQNVIGGLLDECLLGDTQVTTPDGCKHLQDVRVGDFVLGFGTHGWQPDRVIGANKTGVKPVFKLLFDTGAIIVGSGNHPIATPLGLVTIDQLQYAQEVIVAPPSYEIKPRGEGYSQQEARRSDAGNGVGHELYTGDAREEIGVERQAGDRNDAYPIGTGELENGAAVAYLVRRGEGQDVGHTHRLEYGAELCCQGAVGVGQAGRGEEVRALDLRGTLRGDDQRGTGDSELPLRAVLCAVRASEYEPGLYGYPDLGRADHRGDQGRLGGASVSGEAISSRELGEGSWHVLRGADRARVVSVEPVGFAPVFNIETEQTHTFVANGVLTHNCNYMQIVENSKQNMDSEVFDQAQVLYNTIRERRNSRFIKDGKLAGMLCLASSKRYPGEFTDRKIEEAVREVKETGKTTIYVYDKRVWEVKPERFFTGKWFRIFLGDNLRKPRILKETELVPLKDEQHIMLIPKEFESSFKNDILAAIRNIAGHSTYALNPFIMDPEPIEKCFGTTHSIFNREACDFVATTISTHPKKFLHVDQPRWVHLDLALTGDAAGVSCGYIKRFVPVKRSNTTVEMLPEIVFDFLLRVVRPENSEIIFFRIRDMLIKLRALGLPIKYVSMDTFQSADTRQILASQGFMTGVRSVDETTMPYDVLKTAMQDGRVLAPTHEVAMNEVIHLERNMMKNKIDHPPHGCFTGDTRVALADGTCPTFKELREYYGETDPFYVYAIGPEGVEIVPARNSRITKKVGKLVEVLLDNFQVVRCTPEHSFMTLYGEWVHAENLTPDVSIMPLYRTVEVKGGNAGYERVWCPVREERLLTHRLAMGLPPGHLIVHHEDECKRNNDPRNLSAMPRLEHAFLHAEENWAGRRAKMLEGHSKYYEDGSKREEQANRMRQLWADGRFGPPRQGCAIEGCSRMTNARGLCDLHYQRAKRAGKLPSHTSGQTNHKALAVRWVEANEDVYDITVPGLQNFALASGVFVHNSKDVADSMAGVAYGLTMRTELWHMHGVQPTNYGEVVGLKKG